MNRSIKVLISLIFIAICAILLWFVLGPRPSEKENEMEEAVSLPGVLVQSLITGNGSIDSTTQSILEELYQNMVFVEGGSFMMGCEDSQALDNEKPLHQVTLSSFYIGKYEVTQQQWEAVMGNNPSYFKGEHLPVEYVSWEDVEEFILHLNALTGKQYRLPTEAEWEFAARGGNQSKGYLYSGSNDLGSAAWYLKNSRSRSQSIGTKLPNELGLFDMSGNVWEWCNDWYQSYYYIDSPEDNPQGAKSGNGRVLRGGAWGSYADYIRLSVRYTSSPDSKGNSIGFRLVFSEN